MEQIVIETIKKVVNESKKKSGWSDLAFVGNKLAKEGLNFKSMGFLKLKDMFLDPDVENIFELKADNSNPPVFSVREKKLTYRSNNACENFRDDEPNLMEWAYMGDFQVAITKLKNLALEERWYYERQNPSYPYPILSNYLKYTFVRLIKQNRVKYNANYAAFNTGLVNKLYDPIYALFEKNKIQNKQEWFFLNFCVAGQEREGKTLVNCFNPLPERATYADSSSDYFYDGKSEPIMDWNHIILENVDRLPVDFLTENKPDGFIIRDTEEMEEKDKRAYYVSFAKAIENDAKVFRMMQNRIKDALKVAMKRVEWNFKTAIPMYYPRYNTFSLLLPLALVDEDKIDVALVIEKTTSGLYQGQTILPLEWAYSDARLITRPDSDWLVANNIE